MHACIICSIPVWTHDFIRRHRYTVTWTCEFRVVYHDGAQVRVSGVGRSNGAALLYPPEDPLLRWDSRECKTIELQAGQYQISNAHHGFMFHESCWRVLQKVSEPAGLDLPRLFDVCNSLSIPEGLTSGYWGHSYGGLWTVEDGKAYVWQEQFFTPVDRHGVEWDDATEDPFRISEVLRLFTTDIKVPFENLLQKDSQDCFMTLPRELRDKVAALLTTEDAFNLRLASASFLPILTSEHFWASRFHYNDRKGFIFETPLRGYLNWLALYKAFKFDGPSGLRNRYRIWGLAKLAVGLVRQELSIPIATNSSLSDINWSWVTSNILYEAGRGLRSGFDIGCRSLGTCSVTVPKDLLEVGIRIVDMDMGTYVTGIRFVSKHGGNIKLGYVSTRSEVRFRTAALHGLRTALSKTGIRALQVIGEMGCHFQWAGDPTELPISDGLVKDGPVQGLSISYDGFKIVGIAISDGLIRSDPIQGLSGSHDGFKNGGVVRAKDVPEETGQDAGREYLENAAWYPEVPLKQSYLNYSFPRHPHFSTPSFLPLVYVDFGGPNGDYLQYLQRITIDYLHRLHSIEFHYGRNPFNLTSKRLGLGDSKSSRSQSPGKVFQIDGPAGDRIISVEIVAHRSDIDDTLPGALKGIRFTTNHHQKLEITWSNSYDKLQRLPLAEGTVITGLYARQDETDGICSLRLVSQAVKAGS